MTKTFRVLLFAALLFATPGLAQTHGGHGGHMSGMAAATDTMMQGMQIEPSGDVDIDFARAMIAHHQGAVDMAKAVLDRTEVPVTVNLATTIITAQSSEIRYMEQLLADRS